MGCRLALERGAGLGRPDRTQCGVMAIGGTRTRRRPPEGAVDEVGTARCAITRCFSTSRFLMTFFSFSNFNIVLSYHSVYERC